MFYNQILLNNKKHVTVRNDEDLDRGFILPRQVVSSTMDLFKSSLITGLSVDKLTEKLIKKFSINETYINGSLLIPFDAPEVWAFGVTYMDSMKERQSESDTPDVYAKVYNADRPEAFFKGTTDRIQPPLGDVGIRSDSTWDVPEPELAFMIMNSKIAAFTVGNDMSSRSIEGENPLYLPQAKVYDKSLSIGPFIVPIDNVEDPQDLEVKMSIFRENNLVFEGTTNTSNMKRNCEYLLDWLLRHNSVPDGTIVLTGTGIIPPPEFSLKESDNIRIKITGIGELVNSVVKV